MSQKRFFFRFSAAALVIAVWSTYRHRKPRRRRDGDVPNEKQRKKSFTGVSKIIVVTGATRSGKTTFARKYQKYQKSIGVACHLLSLDEFRAYTLLKRKRIVDAFGRRDWEDPRNIAWKHFEEMLGDVRDKGINGERCRIIVVEGFCILHSQYVRENADAIVYIDIDRDTCKSRRSRSKNPAPSGWTFDEYFDRCIWPRHEAYCRIVRSASIALRDPSTFIQANGTDSPNIIFESARRALENSQ